MCSLGVYHLAVAAVVFVACGGGLVGVEIIARAVTRIRRGRGA
jgi:hypothetical protein